MYTNEPKPQQTMYHKIEKFKSALTNVDMVEIFVWGDTSIWPLTGNSILLAVPFTLAEPCLSAFGLPIMADSADIPSILLNPKAP